MVHRPHDHRDGIDFRARRHLADVVKRRGEYTRGLFFESSPLAFGVMTTEELPCGLFGLRFERTVAIRYRLGPSLDPEPPMSRVTHRSTAASTSRAAPKADKPPSRAKANAKAQEKKATGWGPKPKTEKAPAVPSKAEVAKKNAEDLAFWQRMEAGGVAPKGTVVKVQLKQQDPTIPPEILQRAVDVQQGRISSNIYRSADETQAFRIHTLAASPGVKVERISKEEARNIDWVPWTTSPGGW